MTSRTSKFIILFQKKKKSDIFFLVVKKKKSDISYEFLWNWYFSIYSFFRKVLQGPNITCHHLRVAEKIVSMTLLLKKGRSDYSCG